MKNYNCVKVLIVVKGKIVTDDIYIKEATDHWLLHNDGIWTE